MQSSNFTVLLDTDAINRASDLAHDVFHDWGWTGVGSAVHITTTLRHLQLSFDVTRDILPPLTLAVMFFGRDLPSPLVAKLRNRTQTRDTLFELWCLGMLAQLHKVEYEPRLSNGKVPDMCVHGRRNIYVECKSHHFLDSVYWNRFQTVAALIREQIDESPVATKAWSHGLRMEVRPDRIPDGHDLAALGKAGRTCVYEQFVTAPDLVPGFQINFVARDQPCPGGYLFRVGVMLVGTEPTELNDSNQRLVICAWPGLRKQKQRCERSLLQAARKQLGSIPAADVGMICIETFSAGGFASDVHKLIEMDQFQRIPLVWMNPHRQSKLIYRDDGADLVKELLPHNAEMPAA